MHKSKILIVEDEAIAAMNLETKLIALGYESAGIAFTGPEAITLCETEHPSLVLMDIKLKGDMDGIEAARIISLKFAIPVVYLTAFSDDSTLFRARGTSPFGYLVKPIRDSAIRSTIEIAMERKRLQSCLEALADFGEFALQHLSPQGLASRLITDICNTLDLDCGFFYESMEPIEVNGDVQPNAYTTKPMRLLAQHGRDERVFGKMFSPPAGITPDADWGESVFTDVQHPLSRLLFKNDAELRLEKTGVWIPIKNSHVLYGFFIGYAFETRTFSSQELSFLSSMASVTTHGLQRVNAERELKLALDLATAAETAQHIAELANRAKSDFLANMSHEIRTPLGAVLGFAEIIATDEDISYSDKQNFIMIMKRNGDLLATVINDILDLSKIEAGKIDLDITEFSLTEMLSDVSESLNILTDAKGLDLKIRTEGAIPRMIYSDSNRLRQVILNIVGNAIKFTSDGFVDVTVKLGTLNQSGHQRLFFIIKDTGCGISQVDAKKLFTPFTQADETVTRKFGGTGLGLALAKRLTNALGGDIILSESTIGVGSTFTVWIDPELAHGVQTAQNTKEMLDGFRKDFIFLDRDRLRGLDILLVEDNLDNQLLISRFLRIAGAIVEFADNGVVAIEKLRQRSYDLILMDLQMPVMDGYTAIASIREKGLKTPIIALTARTMKGERDRCLASGFNDHIAKPVERKELLGKILNYSHKPYFAADHGAMQDSP